MLIQYATFLNFFPKIIFIFNQLFILATKTFSFYPKRVIVSFYALH